MKVVKQTETQKVLLEVLAKSKRPLSVPEMGEAFNKMGREVNKTTIYRALESLLSEEVVVEGVFKSGVKHYELKSRPHHHHLICSECGKIEDVSSGDLETAVERVVGSGGGKGFEIRSHLLEFYGLCGKCK